MATALFQCISPDVAANMYRCLPVAPVMVIHYQSFSNLFSIVFSGDCGSMYWLCLDIAEKSPKTVSFVGIDERAMSSDDPYKLCLIGCVPQKSLRSKMQQEYLSILIEHFMTSVRQTAPLDDAWLRRICNQSVLGDDVDGSAEYCFQAVRRCEQYGRKINYRSMLDGYLGRTYGDGDWNTIVRVMAHLCYLSESANDRLGVRGVVSRLFRR